MPPSMKHPILWSSSSLEKQYSFKRWGERWGRDGEMKRERGSWRKRGVNKCTLPLFIIARSISCFERKHRTKAWLTHRRWANPSSLPFRRKGNFSQRWIRKKMTTKEKARGETLMSGSRNAGMKSARDKEVISMHLLYLHMHVGQSCLQMEPETPALHLTHPCTFQGSSLAFPSSSFPVDVRIS